SWGNLGSRRAIKRRGQRSQRHGLKEVSKNGRDFLHDDPQTQSALAKFAIEFFVAPLWTAQNPLHFKAPFFEAFGVWMAWIGPVAEQALAEIRILPEHSAVMKLGILLIQNSGAGHHVFWAERPISLAHSQCLISRGSRLFN